jgi:hypothetical protein
MNDTPQTDTLEKTTMFATRPKDPICGEALLHARKMERERNEARREAERWRDCFKTGMSMQPKAPSNVFPWENEKSHPWAQLESQ